MGSRERRRGARVRDALRARDRQGNLPPVRPHVRQRLHAGARPRRARRDRTPVRDGPRQGPDPRDPSNRPDLITWGAPKWPPIPPRARTRPGRAVARLDLAMRFWGAPTGALYPPALGHAPAEPWRASIWRCGFGGPRRAPYTPPRSDTPRQSRGAPRFGDAVLGGPDR